MFPGGIAGKFGNRYEAKWLVRQLLDVISGKAQSLRFEGIPEEFEGFEFSLVRNGHVEWHQTKINNPNGNWTLNALKREGVLAAFKSRLAGHDDHLCFFVSQDFSKEADALAQKAKIATNSQEYLAALGEGHSEKFKELKQIWGVDDDLAFAWLRRSYFLTESQSAIESIVATFSDFLFLGTPSSAFEILRDFLERKINQEITTEGMRAELRAEGKLQLKDWSLDPTLRERLERETAAYLDSYIPFGAGGIKIPRSEAQQLVTRLEDERPTVLLLTGIAGAGKSGVIREFIQELTQRDIPHLALRIDQHLDCTSSRALGKAVTDREESPAATLKGMTTDRRSVLIVDQVDAVSEVSGRNGSVKRAVLSLVEDARNFGGMTVVIACRTFDLDNDPRLKALKETHGVAHIEVPLLDWERDVKPLLAARAIPPETFTENQQSLLRLPLNLAVLLECLDGAPIAFATRNDLFTRLLEKKSRIIRTNRTVIWEVVAPLARLAEWMSENQRLDAPADLLSEFGGSLDVLSSEGLIISSRGKVNFFHESFFDYVYARTFSARRKTIEQLLLESEQHLFRRTQVRQILETLRQTDPVRYRKELSELFRSEAVRYHIKLAISQWMGSLPDPSSDECKVCLGLDTASGRIPSLARNALLGSAGWFDRLSQHAWIPKCLDADQERKQQVLWWLSQIAGQRPVEVARLLEDWWAGHPERAAELLGWIGYVKRNKTDGALVDLCCKLLKSNPGAIFDGSRSNHRDLLLHTWASDNPLGAAQILSAYLEAWLDAHPDQHPFERDEIRDLDLHSFQEMAKKAPLAFIGGATPAFTRSINVISARNASEITDRSFQYRYRNGHHFGADAFLDIYRGSLREVAITYPQQAESFLRKLPPEEHEVFTHLWLETIAANGPALGHLLSELLDGPHLLRAGWQGAEWMSLAEAVRATAPQLADETWKKFAALISALKPELEYALQVAKDIRGEGERSPWQTSKYVVTLLNGSGHARWSLLHTIGEGCLPELLRAELRLLRRKFASETVRGPDHLEARLVPSPIQRDRAALMTTDQWLSAIARYNSEEDRRRGRTFLDGGPSQLAGELQGLVKKDPERYRDLLSRIPDSANVTYIRHILWGLAEASAAPSELVRTVIANAHYRPNRPYGDDIARLIEKYPSEAADPTIFDVLAWYVRQGALGSEKSVESDDASKELVTVHDLMDRAGKLRIRGLNGVRGYACEALGSVIWNLPEIIPRAWTLLEERVTVEQSLGVRCCLMRPIVPLFNNDQRRCAKLALALSCAPGANPDASTWLERQWLRLAFPRSNLPKAVKEASVKGAQALEALIRRSNSADAASKRDWWSPLLSHQGVYLLPYLLRWVPEIGKRLLYRLLVEGDDTARLVGAWQTFRASFQNAEFAPLADALRHDGTMYRRLLADIAADAITVEEFRYRAECVLEEAFDDDDKEVRSQASDVFRNLKPQEFERFKAVAARYIESKAYEPGAWAFFHALEEAECKIDDLVIAATERMISDIKSDWASSRYRDLHQVQDLIRGEYTASESNPDLRKRLLDLIDKMFELELYGVEAIAAAHER